MQLRVREGFRAIHCHHCRLQQRCSRNTCQCGTIWHHCTIHRTDPATHKSRKAPKKTQEERQKILKAQQEASTSSRKNNSSKDQAIDPPEVEEGSESIKMKKGRKRKSITQRSYKLKPMRSITTQVRHDPTRLARIKEKEKLARERTQSEAGKANIGECNFKKDHQGTSSNESCLPYVVEFGERYRSASASPAIPLSLLPPGHAAADDEHVIMIRAGNSSVGINKINTAKNEDVKTTGKGSRCKAFEDERKAPDKDGTYIIKDGSMHSRSCNTRAFHENMLRQKAEDEINQNAKRRRVHEPDQVKKALIKRDPNPVNHIKHDNSVIKNSLKDGSKDRRSHQRGAEQEAIQRLLNRGRSTPQPRSEGTLSCHVDHVTSNCQRADSGRLQ